jgi:hypothetical protein
VDPARHNQGGAEGVEDLIGDRSNGLHLAPVPGEEVPPEQGLIERAIRLVVHRNHSSRQLAFVRSKVGSLIGAESAKNLIIQYGGSVKPDNAASLLGQPDVDGALVGGASLDPRSFAQIVRAGVLDE